jgi:hypothetical protein
MQIIADTVGDVKVTCMVNRTIDDCLVGTVRCIGVPVQYLAIHCTKGELIIPKISKQYPQEYYSSVISRVVLRNKCFLISTYRSGTGTSMTSE